MAWRGVRLHADWPHHCWFSCCCRSLPVLLVLLRPGLRRPCCRCLPPSRSADFDTVRQIKEKLCYMAFDVAQEAKVSRGGRGRLARGCVLPASVPACPTSQPSAHPSSLPRLPASPRLASPLPPPFPPCFGCPLLCLPLALPAWEQLARETTTTTSSYQLPDGRTIRVGAERFAAPEALMDPR